MCTYAERTRVHPCRYFVYSKLTVAILSPLKIGTGCFGPSCLGLVVRRALEIGASRQAGNRAAKTQRWMQSRDRRVERRAGHPPEFRRTDFVFFRLDSSPAVTQSRVRSLGCAPTRKGPGSILVDTLSTRSSQWLFSRLWKSAQAASDLRVWG